MSSLAEALPAGSGDLAMNSSQLACPQCGSILTFGADLAPGAAVECLICGQAFAASAELSTTTDTPPSSAHASKVAEPRLAEAEAKNAGPRPSGAAPKLARPKVPSPKRTKPAVLVAKKSRPEPVLEPSPRRLMAPGLWIGAAVLCVLLFLGVAIGFRANEPASPAPSAATIEAPAVSSGEVSAVPRAIAATTTPNDDADTATPEEKITLQRKARAREAEVAEIEPKEPEAKTPLPVAPPAGAPAAAGKPMAPPPPRAMAKEPAAINQAIERGIKFLRGHPWIHPAHTVAYTALGGLTLLECGVPANDPMIQRAADFVRSQAGPLNHTYEISLSILFLDRLGQPTDRRLIQGLGLRLLAGQTAAGGWSYGCPALPANDMAQLYKFLRSHRPATLPSPLPALAKKDWPNLVGAKASLADPFRQFGELVLTKGIEQPQPSGPDKAAPENRSNLLASLPAGPEPKPAPPATAAKPIPPMRPEALPAHLRHLPIVLLESKSKAKTQNGAVHDDNSNTQFALLALWVARRHDVPTEQALLHSYRRFNVSQLVDGHWDYHLRGHPTGPAMTAVGLLGLAMGHGASAHLDKEAALARANLQDPAIRKGLHYLSQFVGTPQDMDLTMPSMYFLWSVERVAVLYDLKTVGGKDWYAWGSQILLANQHADGSWANGHFPGSTPHVDTCLALLFLKRSNLVQDLTDNLRLYMPIRDSDYKP
jgi:hypothetical protein